jgi:hypothetical protein
MSCACFCVELVGNLLTFGQCQRGRESRKMSLLIAAISQGYLKKPAWLTDLQPSAPSGGVLDGALANSP